MVSSSSSDDSLAQKKDEETSKTKRGRTVLAKVLRHRDKHGKMNLQWNTYTQAIGPNRPNFKSYLGKAAHSRVDLNIPRWDKVPEHIKEAIWTDVSGVFDIPKDRRESILTNAGNLWRDFKSKLGKKMYDKDKNVNPHPPTLYTFIDQEMWDKFVRTRQTKEFKVDSQKHREIAKMNIYPYRASRKGYPGLEQEMILQAQKEAESSENPTAKVVPDTIRRHKLWTKARTGKDGSMHEATRQMADKMDLVEQQAAKGEIQLSGRQDVLATALEKKEHPGRVRGAGSGVTITQYWGKRTLENDKLKAMEEELLFLKRELFELKRKDKHVHNGEAEIPSDKASCPDVVFPEGWTECQLASLEPGHPIVANGKVYNASGTEIVMVHNIPLEPDNMKVSVVDPIDGEAPLPVPTDEAAIVIDAKNSFVQWPKNLIYLYKGLRSPVPYPHKGRERSGNVDNDSESSSTMIKSQKRKAGSDKLISSEQARKLSTTTLEMMHKIARRLEKTISIPIPTQLSFDGVLWVTKEEILQWIFQEEIQTTHVSVYFGYLFDKHREKKLLDEFGFICPHKIADIPVDFQGEQAKERSSELKLQRANGRARYIADAMENATKKHMFFAPYSAGRHWMLCVIHPFKEIVYWLDSVGEKPRDDIRRVVDMSLKMWIAKKSLKRPNKSAKWIEVKCPRQTNNTDCGYYVLRFIQEIIRKGQDNVPDKYYPESPNSMPYPQEKIDEIRDQWATFVQRFMN